MHPDLEKLLALQDVDREITRLTEEVAALPRRVAEIETKLAGAKAAVQKTKTANKAAGRWWKGRQGATPCKGESRKACSPTTTASPAPAGPRSLKHATKSARPAT